LAQVVELSDAELALGEDFLNFHQTNFCFGNELAFGKLEDQVAILIFGATGVSEVAIRLFHFLIVNVGDLKLCFGRLRHVGEEGDEVFVFDLGLRQRGGSTSRTRNRRLPAWRAMNSESGKEC
jgi:hypothetical protein